jgi:hypothetical protein
MRGKMEFRKDYPQSQTLFLYRGEEQLLTNQVLCLPCQTFLKALSLDVDLSFFFRDL